MHIIVTVPDDMPVEQVKLLAADIKDYADWDVRSLMGIPVPKLDQELETGIIVTIEEGRPYEQPKSA